MAPHDDRDSQESTPVPPKAAHVKVPDAHESPLVRISKVGRYVLRFGSQEPDQSAELKKEVERIKSLLESRCTEIEELKGKYQHRKESERAARHARDDITRAFNKSQDQCEEKDHEIAELTEQIQTLGHEAKKREQIDAAEKSKLWNENAEYKKIISTSSHMENQLADDQIRSQIEELFCSIQEFVVKHFRRQPVHFSRLPDHAKSIVKQFAPEAEVLPKPMWLNLINSLVAQVMISTFQPGSFFGEAVSGPISTAVKLTETIQDRKWLVATRKVLEESAKAALQAADRQLADTRTDIVSSILQDVVPVEWTGPMRAALSDIFVRSQQFYRLISSQYSQLEIDMPKLSVDGTMPRFDPKQMDIVNSGLEDDAAVSGHPVEISVFPAVVKTGGKQNAHPGDKMIIAKAKVMPRV